jgi:hypothetical protein
MRIRFVRQRAPKTSPTNLESSPQFVPNWNSITIPGATAEGENQANILTRKCHWWYSRSRCADLSYGEDQKEPQADAEGRKQIMETDREAKLNPGQQLIVHSGRLLRRQAAAVLWRVRRHPRRRVAHRNPPVKSKKPLVHTCRERIFCAGRRLSQNLDKSINRSILVSYQGAALTLCPFLLLRRTIQ